MYILDIIYTYVYNHGSISNKVIWIRQMKQKDTLDYAIFGSSRAVYHINPILIKEKTGKEGKNFGYNASSSFEIYLTINEYLKNNFTKKIFIQVDYKYYKSNPDGVGKISWIPFINEENIYQYFKPFGNKYFLYNKIPFYRYQKFDSRLGIRYVFSNIIKGDNEFVNFNGYIDRFGVLKKDTVFSPKEIITVNPYFADLITICKTKNIELIFFTSPIYRFNGSFKYLDERLPNYYSFSNTISEISLFSDPTHLNSKGAEVFTNLFIEHYFKITP